MPWFFFQHHDQLIIDEAQTFPQIFSQLRVVIDQDRGRKGHFLLSAYASPQLVSQIGESLAGRIGQIEIPSLKMTEYEHKNLSPLYRYLISTTRPEAKNLYEFIKDSKSSRVSVETLERMLLTGSYPENSLNADDWRLWCENIC
jgi:uncharacterized protein